MGLELETQTRSGPAHYELTDWYRPHTREQTIPCNQHSRQDVSHENTEEAHETRQGMGFPEVLGEWNRQVPWLSLEG